MTASLAPGPYSASASATADSTLTAGSTRHRRSVSGGSPWVTTYTRQWAVTFLNIPSCHSSISHVSDCDGTSYRPCFS